MEDEHFIDAVIITDVPEGAERLMLPVLHRDGEGRIRKKLEEITLHKGDMIYGLPLPARKTLYARNMAVPVRIRTLRPGHRENKTAEKQEPSGEGVGTVKRPEAGKQKRQKDLLSFLGGGKQ